MTSPRHPLLARLDGGPLLCDGAMGTLLYERGVPYDRCFDALNLTDRERVLNVHLDYLRAGAEMIETNTFGANAVKLDAHDLGGRVRDVNWHGAKIAKEARDIIGRAIWVAGSVGPLGKPVAPFGRISAAEARDVFRAQIDALVEGGVDALVLETFTDLDELLEAVRAARAACDLPVIAQMSFTDDGRTRYGHGPAEVVAGLEQAGVDVIGANCSVGPVPMLEVIQRMASLTRRPLSAQPNAGFPALVDGRYLYLSSPTHLAAYARKMVEAGAVVIGGCCGTTPAHISAIGQAIADLRPAPFRAVVPEAPGRAEPIAPPVDQPTQLAEKLGRTFVISVEVDPPKGLDATKDLDGARLLKEAGADVIDVGDSPIGRIRMGALAMCYLIQQQVGIETIIHFTTRDRNLMGVQADLIGAHALGVRNILALTGEPPRGDYPNVTAVFDVDSVGLVRIIRRFNEGQDLAGRSIGRPARFLIGCALDMNPETLDREVPRLERKLEAGADFFMTQPIYEPETLDGFERRVGKLPVPVLLGILPLQSFRHAEFLHNEVPGITIPKWVRDRMQAAGGAGREEGLRLGRELLGALLGRIDGAYFMPSFGRYELVATLVREVRTRVAGHAARTRG
ncbi:MAG: bifunctional homocysteine S-methyltransferase/methylenetetrahydrofolate reductase [Bacillati bacterium ANGP1]|uniref:Bifunctional homocysteine S-methyltransferase/methylenetetrahydrofolate reductase n=1 Tax=Candidatus Segetimicrobium genomatis TaxID=2569760 RepID=A0A537M3L6_9BACT|nr:MAG: bifunctional homocysteine S-methyltransferase/methylenetetrahydrofolate reductase [Terrabacteria group bacterium ANGP1]